MSFLCIIFINLINSVFDKINCNFKIKHQIAKVPKGLKNFKSENPYVIELHSISRKGILILEDRCAMWQEETSHGDKM